MKRKAILHPTTVGGVPGPVNRAAESAALFYTHQRPFGSASLFPVVSGQLFNDCEVLRR